MLMQKLNDLRFENCNSVRYNDNNNITTNVNSDFRVNLDTIVSKFVSYLTETLFGKNHFFSGMHYSPKYIIHATFCCPNRSADSADNDTIHYVNAIHFCTNLKCPNTQYYCD